LGYFACEKKEAKLSTSDVSGEVVALVGSGEEDLRCSSLLTGTIIIIIIIIILFESGNMAHSQTHTDIQTDRQT